MVSIDSVLKNSPLHIDLIKIDVEGHEMKCLQGACNTITKNRPAIFCEAVEKDVTEKVAVFLGHLGYEGFWFLNNRYRNDNFLACPVQMHNKLSYDINIIFLHSADSSPSAEFCRRQLVKYHSFNQLTEGLPVLSSFI